MAAPRAKPCAANFMSPHRRHEFKNGLQIRNQRAKEHVSHATEYIISDFQKFLTVDFLSGTPAEGWAWAVWASGVLTDACLQWKSFLGAAHAKVEDSGRCVERGTGRTPTEKKLRNGMNGISAVTAQNPEMG